MPAPAPPFDLPTTRFADGEISVPVVPSALNQLRSGAAHARQIGAAYFEARVQTVPMTMADRGKWEAFFANTRGPGRPVLIYDVRRPYPVSYTDFTGLTRFGGGAFDGTAALSAITSVRELIVNTLPVGLLLKAGDRVGFIEGGRYGLAIIAQDATADASGIVTIYIEPGLPSIFTTAATVQFEKPKGEFLIDQSSIDFGSGLGPQPVSFTATSRVI